MAWLVLLKRFWFAIPILGLLIYVAILRGDVSDAKEDRDKQRDRAARFEERLITTNASLDQAQIHIADNNRRIAEAAARLQQTEQQAAADLARANARWERSGRAVSALEASARDDSQARCEASGAALKALEDL